MNTTLNMLKIGNRAKIVKLNNKGSIHRRLLDMGLIPGTEIECILISPFKDPVAYLIRNTLVAIRNNDSKLIEVEVSINDKDSSSR